MAFTVLNGIYPDQATPELMELTARLGSMLPYRKTAGLLAKFLPIMAAEGHVTVRKRTLTVGARLEEQSLRQEWDNPPMTCERKQLELSMPDDPQREFVVSIDTAHVRCADPKAARNFEIGVARCGRGGRGSPPGHHFTTTDTWQCDMRARTLQALQSEGPFWTRREHDSLGWRGDHEAASNGVVEARNSHHRLGSSCDEDPANETNCRS
jgi:hypothetical protein